MSVSGLMTDQIHGRTVVAIKMGVGNFFFFQGMGCLGCRVLNKDISMVWKGKGENAEWAAGTA